MAIHGVVALSVPTLVHALREAGFGEPHPVLLEEPMWIPRARRDEVSNAFSAELERAGLLARGGIAGEFLPALRCLSAATVEYFGWFHAQQKTVGILCAASGRTAVCAVREGDVVELRQVEPERLAAELIGQLPHLGPARFRAVNVPVDAVRQALSGTGRGSGGLMQPVNGGVSDDVRRLKEIMNVPETGSGELHVAARDGTGRYARAQHAIGVTDRGGRILRVLSGPVNGPLWAVIAPAGPRDLADRLHEAHRDLTGAGSHR